MSRIDSIGHMLAEHILLQGGFALRVMQPWQLAGMMF